MATLDALLALAIPWYAGALVIAVLFPAIPILGRIGLGWGVGLGSVTFVMFGLSVINIPFTGAVVGFVLLLCVVGFAWLAPQLGGLPAAEEVRETAPAAPAWLRWPMIASVGLILGLITTVDALWPVTDWDALAAYDLRGRAFARFDSVAVAAHHGNLSYSLWQPPFTSLAHSWLYESAGMDAPVKLLYATCFAALIAGFVCFVTLYRSELIAYITLPGLLLSPLAQHAVIAYTNLPSAYGVFVASWATYATMRTSKRRWCLLAGVLWGFAMWTRQSLDPFVGLGVAALSVPWLRHRRIPSLAFIAAGITLVFAYSWYLYTVYLLYRVTLRQNVAYIAQSCAVILGPAIALSCGALLFSWAYRRRIHWYLLAVSVVLCLPILFVLRHRLVNLALMQDVFGYLRLNLWPMWGPLLLVFVACVVLGIPRFTENMGYVALFGGYCAIFVVSTYAFAVQNPAVWQQIPGSALRHSFAILPVFWASVAIMPGTARIVEAVAVLRPAGWRVPAVQGDG